MLVVLVLVMGATLAIVSRHINEQARTETRRILTTAEAVLRHSLATRVRHFVSRCRISANDPQFRSVAQLGDAATTTEFLRASLHELGNESEILVFCPAPGRVSGRARRDAALSFEEFTSAAADIMLAAFQGDARSGVIHHGGRILNVVSVPVVAADRRTLLGTLTLGTRLGPAIAQELQSLTNADVVFLVDDQIAVSTLRRPAPDLLRQVTTGEAQTLLIEDEHFLARAGKYEENGAPRGVDYVLLSSFEPRIRALRRTQALLVAIALAGIGISVVAGRLFSRRLAKPLRALRAGAEAVGRGDFSQRVDTFPDDESGQLARAFNQMTASVEKSHASLERTVEIQRASEERLRADKLRLSESEGELRTVIASVRDHAILTLDPQGHVVRWNPAATHLFGYDATEAAGLAYASFFNTEDRALKRPAQLLADTAKEGKQSFEGRRVRRDGSCFWADVTLSHLPDSPDGAGGGVVEIVRDATVRKDAADTQRHALDAATVASRSQIEFLTRLAREIRTPINALLEHARLLLEQKLLPAQQQPAGAIRTTAASLLAAVDEIADFSTLESGGIELRPLDFDLRTTVEHVAAEAASACGHKQIGFEMRIAPELPPMVHADAGRVGQVLHILISNAVKFTERGHIELTVVPAPDLSADHVRCSVADTGIGIPHERQGELFRPFFQVESTAAHRGTGLGLAIAKRLVERLGGTIACESMPGQGSRFSFTFLAPASAYDRVPPKLPPPATAESGPSTHSRMPASTSGLAKHMPMRVLVVEDNLVNVKVLTLILAKLGYKADTALNGNEALKRLDQHAYDVVFMDLQMPEMDGLEATRRLRTRVPVTSPPYILAFTANATTEDRGACTAAGMHDFESKPANIEKIARSLERAYAWLTANGSRTSGN